MKTVLKLFTHNWGIKLLALVLALTVYYSLRESSRHNSDSERGIFWKGTDTVGNHQ